MLYAKVNEKGEVIDVATSQSKEYTLLVAPDQPVVANILESKFSESSANTQDMLTDSDSDMMRIIEDLIDLLSEKRLIQFTELPLAAQKKLLSRKWVRGVHNGHDDSLMIDSNHDEDSQDDALI
ncbi:hypothetical protein MUS1_05225 [Marinomonas ushuaiensis DSM 15871]|uniref:Tryptophan synthase subunit beta like protein n=1 Tax=Marinomonas ushuaiensis DSM 15871 TaxID=1122207 RepID=X7E3Y1_9GAMM|nr:hypothetical protein [Marinomonas ushuaiensis]ETX09863.1 hypothetical protein MUS1_05225 [Marinomonas ushuaiensis DSM 15871]